MTPPGNTMDAFFDAPDICNAHLRAARDNSVLYALYTMYSILGAKPKFTRLEYPASPPQPEAPLNTPAGTIDWRARTITLAGATRSVDALKRHSGRTPSARAWRWPAHTREYDVDVDGGLGGSGRWTVRQAYACAAGADPSCRPCPPAQLRLLLALCLRCRISSAFLHLRACRSRPPFRQRMCSCSSLCLYTPRCDGG